jgi:protein-S-isoprenylcysteine O-methyltransferase Ste14
MVKFGNFIFKYRNIIFPIFFVVLVLFTGPPPGSEKFEKYRYLAGITVAFTGQAIRAMTIGLAYIVRGGRDRKVYAKALVKDGIFAHCRNPLYLGNILIVVGLGIVAHSIPFYIIGIPLFLFMYLSIIMAEEHFLRGKFGEEYVEYCRNVNRLIPNLSGIKKTIKSMTFNWQRLIIKEYGTTYLWVTCVILLVAKNHYLRYSRVQSRESFLILFILLIIVTSLYAVARYLKKTRRLTEKH